MPKNDFNQVKNFGPKKGLNKAEAPLKRMLPSGPNAGSPEFATEFKNLYFDPDDGVMKPRKGFQFVSDQLGELGIHRYNNYDVNGVARPQLFCLDRSGVSVIEVGTFKIEVTDAQEHTFTIVYHPSTSRYEVVNLDAAGTELDRLSIASTDLDSLSAQLTGLNIVTGDDLYIPNRSYTSVALQDLHPIVNLQIGPDCSKELKFDSILTINSCVSLSDVDVTSPESRIATFAEINNILFIAIKDKPLLKYSGNCLSKAGLPDPDKVSKDDSVKALGKGLDDMENESNPLWATDAEDGTNFALTLAQAAGGSVLKGIDAFYRARQIDTSISQSIYAIAYENLSTLSNAVGAEDNEDDVFVTEVENNSTDFIDKTVSPSQNLAPAGPNLNHSHEITVKNLQENAGWEVTGANVGNIGWVLGTASDINNGTTNFTIPVIEHNFSDKHKDQDVYLNVRMVGRTNVAISTNAFYRHQQYLVKTKLIDFTATTVVVSKDLTMYDQPGGLQGRAQEINYDNLGAPTIPGGLGLNFNTFNAQHMGIMITGGISLDTFINIYESVDTPTTTAGQGFKDVDYPDGSFLLVAQLANNPFADDQVFYNWYDRNFYGDLYTSQNIVGQTNRDTRDLVDHSSLPAGTIITSHQGRLYVTGDPEAINTVYATSIVYGPEKYDVTGDESFDIRDDVGDFITGLSPLGPSLAVLKANSVHIVSGDFATGNIRRDIVASEGFGCTSHHSIAQVKDGIAYLSEEGVVYWQYSSRPQMMGSVYLNREAGSQPMSRIRYYVTRPDLDLARAVAFNDSRKELYILHIPEICSNESGLSQPKSGDGITLVYDYMNDCWFEYENFAFRSGMDYIDGKLYRADSFADGTGIKSNILRELDTASLYDYHDALLNKTTLLPISTQYDTDWEAFLEPSVIKKPMHAKIYAYNVEEDVEISNAVLDLGFKGEFTLTIEAYKDYRENSLHSKGRIKLDSRKLAGRMKMRSQKAFSAKVSIKHSEIFKCPVIMGIELEFAVVHRGHQKPWGAS